MAYKITSQDLPGLAKLAEEASEVAQVAAKIIGGCDTPAQLMHLEDEMGDLYAALGFFIGNNPGVSWERIVDRAHEKAIRWEAKQARRLVANG